MEKLTLSQKLIKIQESVKIIKNDSEVNEGFRFKYASSENILFSVRHAMDENKVLLLPTILEAKKEFYTNSSGKISILTELIINYDWIDAENPIDKLSFRWYTQGTDTTERGVGKALTYGEKYFILKFFHIPTTDNDPDAYQDDEKPQNKAKPSNNKQANQQAAQKQRPPQAANQQAGQKPTQPAPVVTPRNVELQNHITEIVNTRIVTPMEVAGYVKLKGKNKFSELTDAEAESVAIMVEKLVAVKQKEGVAQ